MTMIEHDDELSEMDQAIVGTVCRIERRVHVTREQRIAYANDNRAPAELAAELGIGLSTIWLWRRKYRGEPA